MKDFFTQILDASSKMSKEMSRNYMSECVVAEVVSADKDGSNAAIKLADNYVIDSELCMQTMFTIEQVIEIPTSQLAQHHHTINSSLNDVMGVTASGPVFFVPTGTDMTALEDPEAFAKFAADSANMQTLSLNHDHGGKTEKALPNIRLWRGIQAGDRVLVLKVNPRTFIILCRVGDITNETGDTDVTTYT